MALLSIVLPAYNEEQNIANTTAVLTGVLEENKIEYELIFISDGSVDGTFDAIQREAEKNPRIKGAEFSRNFGKEAGIFAGLRGFRQQRAMLAYLSTVICSILRL